jgi:hypothetical protein
MNIYYRPPGMREKARVHPKGRALLDPVAIFDLAIDKNSKI